MAKFGTFPVKIGGGARKCLSPYCKLSPILLARGRCVNENIYSEHIFPVNFLGTK